MSGPSAELHVSALREPLLGATSDRMSEKPRLDVVIGKGTLPYMAPKGSMGGGRTGEWWPRRNRSER